MHITLSWHGQLPVKGYGGTERVVVWLARGLLALGNRVSLIAGEGSNVPGVELIPVSPKQMRTEDFDIAPLIPPGTDILHAHFPLRKPPDLPWVWTLHGNSQDGVVRPPNTIFVSGNHAERHGSRAFVYNGIDPDDHIFQEEKEDYDFFIGTMHHRKGYHLAIEGARRTGRRLILAGGWRPTIRRGIKFAGTVDGEEKTRLLAGALCVWMPALWDEPFGLTLVESLMSGTPVIGTRRGSLPEIITPDVGGLGDDLDDLVEIARTIDEKRNPTACRRRAEQHFSHMVMAREYVRFYEHYLREGVLPEGKHLGRGGSR